MIGKILLDTCQRGGVSIVALVTYGKRDFSNQMKRWIGKKKPCVGKVKASKVRNYFSFSKFTKSKSIDSYLNSSTIWQNQFKNKLLIILTKRQFTFLKIPKHRASFYSANMVEFIQQHQDYGTTQSYLSEDEFGQFKR